MSKAVDKVVDGARNWIDKSNQKKSKGGFIFMCCAGAIFVGVLGWIFMQL